MRPQEYARENNAQTVNSVRMRLRQKATVPPTSDIARLVREARHVGKGTLAAGNGCKHVYSIGIPHADNDMEAQNKYIFNCRRYFMQVAQ